MEKLIALLSGVISVIPISKFRECIILMPSLFNAVEKPTTLKSESIHEIYPEIKKDRIALEDLSMIKKETHFLIFLTLIEKNSKIFYVRWNP